MITLSYETIRKDQSFGNAFQKIRQCRTFPIKTAYSVGKIIRVVESEWKQSEKLWADLLDRHCEKEESGAVKIEKGQFKLLEGHDKDFEKDAREFLALSFTIDWNKLTLNDLEALKDPALTPDELMALEPLIHHLDVVQTKEK